MPQVFQWFEATNPTGLEHALAEYLADGVRFPVSRADILRWIGPSREAGDILRKALDEPPERYSSAELVLLALPRMDPLPRSVHEIDRIVGGFWDAIRLTHEAGDDELLSALAEYGRRWEVIVETEVPIDEPTTIRLIEDRPLGLDQSGWIEQVVSLGDTQSASVQVRVIDNTVGVRDFDVQDLDRRAIGIPLLEAARKTSEGFSLYSAVPDRPYYIRIRVRLRALPYVRWTGWLVAAIAGLATLVALVVPDGNNLADNLALLAVPTTFAVALILVREQTALAVRLQMRARTITLIVTGLLWLVVFTRLIAAGIDDRWLQTLTEHLYSLASSLRAR